MPQRFARPGHAHGERQQGEQHAIAARSSGSSSGLVGPHARVVVDVARTWSSRRPGAAAACRPRRRGRAPVSSSCARCSGFRVWNATTLARPMAASRARVSARREPQIAKVRGATAGAITSQRAADVQLAPARQLRDQRMARVGRARHTLRRTPRGPSRRPPRPSSPPADRCGRRAARLARRGGAAASAGTGSVIGIGNSVRRPGASPPARADSRPGP